MRVGGPVPHFPNGTSELVRGRICRQAISQEVVPLTAELCTQWQAGTTTWRRGHGFDSRLIITVCTEVSFSLGRDRKVLSKSLSHRGDPHGRCTGTPGECTSAFGRAEEPAHLPHPGSRSTPPVFSLPPSACTPPTPLFPQSCASTFAISSDLCVLTNTGPLLVHSCSTRVS